jgi:hypothetical protein
MLLPNRELAWISSAKLTDYLLSPVHSIGKAKAQFFGAHGYWQHNADILERDLLNVARTGELMDSLGTPFGQKFIVDGQIITPVGKNILLRTVWIIEPDDERPRFVRLPCWRKTMIEELSIVVLARDIEQYGLACGDIGTVVHVYRSGEAFEVEFTTGSGVTIAVLTIEAKDLRPMQDQEILHVRRLAA